MRVSAPEEALDNALFEQALLAPIGSMEKKKLGDLPSYVNDWRAGWDGSEHHWREVVSV